jgi:hypothetical protein
MGGIERLCQAKRVHDLGIVGSIIIGSPKRTVKDLPMFFSHVPKETKIRIKLVETIDGMVNTQMELSPGITLLGMVLDTLSGRTLLYRLMEFFEEKGHQAFVRDCR